MSDEHLERSPLDEALPGELARLERRLANVPPPASSLSRETLLFQAGWAAAEQHHGVAAVGLHPPSADRTRTIERQRWSTWAWSLASAVVSASVTLGLANAMRTEQPAARETVAVVESVAPAEASRREPNALAVLPPTTGRRLKVAPWLDFNPKAALLIERQRALRQRWDDPWESSRGMTATPPVPPVVSPPSLRDMMHEFLRPASSQQRSDPPAVS